MNNYNIKYVVFFILYSISFFIRNIYININNYEIINIDNEFKEKLYENEKIFNDSKTKLKPIAFYYPEYNNISYYKYFNKILKKGNITKNKINNLVNEQIKLAKAHQIYGFGIFYNLFNLDKISRITINMFLIQNKIPFFLIWRNDGIDNININILEILLDNIRKYLINDNYIKFNGKPILSINNPNKIKNIINIIADLRKLSEKKIGKLFILYPFIGNYSEQSFINQFDGIYDFSKFDLFQDITNRPNIIYYSGFIYKNLILNNLDVNIKLFRTCYLNYKYYIDYKPEKFYMQNKLIFQSENEKYKLNYGFIFIDSWNDYSKGNYLEFDEKFGFSSINSFSKSILNIFYKTNNFIYNINNNTNMIAIQVHVYYEELFYKILNRLKIIPFKFDLFISTVTEVKKLFIEKLLMDFNISKYEIKIFKNIGRDVYPFIRQIRNHYKQYKYISHFHTKKSIHKKLLGSNWSEYIYNNLIGNKEIISDIIYDFENNDKLGFIFPEPYYEIIKGVKNFYHSNMQLNKPNNKFINYLLKKIFHKYTMGDKIIFPVGNMFWARTKAIYQIFNIRLKYPEELNQTNETIMHGIERLWLYLVKLNGYDYKMIFRHY